ncbi:MAG: adenosylhomocysteinase [Pseudomonadota bacterium]
MVDQPIAACHARPQHIQDSIQLAFLTLSWVAIAALGQPAFATSESIPIERTLIDLTLVQQDYIKASNTDAQDRFGEVLAIDGDTMVVGAQFEDSSASGVNGDQSNDPSDPTRFDAGAVYVFVRDELGIWSQQAYLKASNTDSEDRFGTAVAISGDTIVVGADDEDSNATGVNGDASNNSAPFSGAAYVFVRDEFGVWTQQAYLKASNAEARDDFGQSVSIAAAEGHPASVMDMSFAGQAMAAKYLADNKGKIENSVHTMPVELDMDISARKLAAMGIDIDVLTEEQEKYLNSWEEGT